MSAPDPLADPFDDLPATLEEAWATVERGVHDRRSPFHTPALATTGLDGQPRLRIVVLRGFDRETRTLRVHTDRRSDKVAEIAREPRVALLGYDVAAKLQVRLEGRAGLHLDDAVADAAWEGSRPMSRAAYGTIPPLGFPDSSRRRLPPAGRRGGARRRTAAFRRRPDPDGAPGDPLSRPWRAPSCPLHLGGGRPHGDLARSVARDELTIGPGSPHERGRPLAGWAEDATCGNPHGRARPLPRRD